MLHQKPGHSATMLAGPCLARAVLPQQHVRSGWRVLNLAGAHAKNILGSPATVIIHDPALLYTIPSNANYNHRLTVVAPSIQTLAGFGHGSPAPNWPVRSPTGLADMVLYKHA